MEFKDTKTDEVITLADVKEWYINTRKEGNSKYINFQDFLIDQINKYRTIELI